MKMKEFNNILWLYFTLEKNKAVYTIPEFIS